MNHVYDIVKSTVEDIFSPDDKAKDLIKQALKIWLAQHSRGTQDQVQDMSVKIDHMVDHLVISIENDSFVINAGENSDILELLDRGSLWFPPHPDVVREIVDAYLS